MKLVQDSISGRIHLMGMTEGDLDILMGALESILAHHDAYDTSVICKEAGSPTDGQYKHLLIMLREQKKSLGM